MKKVLLILLLPLFAFTTLHKFYISVTNVEYSQKGKTLQITSRIFVDDLEDLLEERYEILPKLTTDEEMENVNSFIAQYLNDQITISVNGEPKKFMFLGKVYDDDIMKCYMEIEGIKKDELKSIKVVNKVLFDLFPDQQNIVHIKVGKSRRSFILIKGNDKGLLNF